MVAKHISTRYLHVRLHHRALQPWGLTDNDLTVLSHWNDGKNYPKVALFQTSELSLLLFIMIMIIIIILLLLSSYYYYIIIMMMIDPRWLMFTVALASYGPVAIQKAQTLFTPRKPWVPWVG